MKLTTLETESLKRILKRELTMIGGDREFAGRLLHKIGNTVNNVADEQETAILEAVAEYYGIDRVDIIGKSREMPMPDARKLASLLLHNADRDINRVTQILNVDRTMYYALREKWSRPDIVRAYNSIKAGMK